MKRAAFLLMILLTMQAHADEKNRNAIIGRIIAAQQLPQIFEQQQQQSKASYEELGKSIFQKMITDLGTPDQKINPRFYKAFSDYMDRCSTLLSVEEQIAMWTSLYGKDMSEDELKQALAYYESPIGKKDVQASQVAMIGFSQMVTTEFQKRNEQSLSKLIADIRAATKQ